MQPEPEPLISKQAMCRCPQGQCLPGPWLSMCAAGRDTERLKSKWPPGWLAAPSLLPSERQHPQPATARDSLKGRLSLVEAGVGGEWVVSWQLHKERSCLLCPE